MIEIRILGSLEVRLMGCPVVPTAAKPRTVLALLAVHANRFVPIELVVGELWGTAPPRKSKAVIQTYVLQLRKLIATALRRCGERDADARSKQILGTGPSGYILNCDAEIDAVHFERITEAGHRAREQGNYPDASKFFAQALALWRGRALTDVQQGAHLNAELCRLEEMRLNVLDCRIGADLKIGRNHEVLGELTALIASHPTHEGLCAHLMLALYRSGRRLEALEVYRRLRTNLVAEAGLEPSPALRRLHRSMLTPERVQEDIAENWRAAASASAKTAMPAAPLTRIPADIAAEPWAVGGGTLVG